MTTGFFIQGRGDLDGIFKARTSAPIANTNFRSSGGVDLSQRFEPRGATAAVANTGFRAVGGDLAQLFMDLGALTGTITIANVNWLATVPLSPTATALSGLRITPAGEIFRLQNGATTYSSDWITPKAAAPGGYTVQVGPISGAFAAGSSPINTFLPLSGGPYTWWVEHPTSAGAGNHQCQFIRQIGDAASNPLALASDFIAAQVVANGTLIADVSMTAAANSGLTTQVGFQRYVVGLADFGSVSSQAVNGSLYLLEQLCRRQNGTGNLFGLSTAGSTSPANADTTWQRCEVTGIFSDSAGASVTRILTRSACTVTDNRIESGRAFCSWEPTASAQPWPFIAGNVYGVKIYKDP